MCRSPTVLTLALAAVVWQAAAAAAQTAPEAGAITAAQSRAPATDTAAQLERIKNAISVRQTVKLDEDQLRFYVQIVVKRPTFADYLKGQDLINAPTKRGNPMTHQEFMRMMTPQGLFSR